MGLGGISSFVKETGEYEPNGSSVREFAYQEDKNYRFRPNMEDSKYFYFSYMQPIVWSTKLQVIPVVDFLLYSMDMEGVKCQITAQKDFQLKSVKRYRKAQAMFVPFFNVFLQR